MYDDLVDVVMLQPQFSPKFDEIVLTIHKIRERSVQDINITFTVGDEQTSDLGTYIRQLRHNDSKLVKWPANLEWKREYMGEFLPGDAD